jgi:hypothetical protein
MANMDLQITLSEEMRPPGKPARAFSFDGSGTIPSVAIIYFL